MIYIHTKLSDFLNENTNNSDTQRLEKIYDFFVSGKEIPNEVCVGNNACALLKLATPSIQDEDVLYNTNKRYNTLYDKSETNELSEKEEAEMKAIYNTLRLKAKSETLLKIYDRYIEDDKFNDLIKFIESEIFK
jgi:hypothetical protein